MSIEYSHSCSELDSCKIPQIKELLIGCNYFGKNNNIQCRCFIRRPIYSSEWDYEYKQRIEPFFEGVFIASDYLKELLSGNVEDIPEELDIKIRSIPSEEKQKIIEILEEMIKEIPQQNLTRVSIWNENNYRGFIDIRPIGEISEAFLKPPLWMNPPRYYLTCDREHFPEFTLRPKETEIERIRCVPYVRHAGMPELGVCAQYSVRLVLLILSQGAPTVPELTFKGKTFLPGGMLRREREGWNIKDISRVLEGYGVSNFRYEKILPCPKCGSPIDSIKCPNCDAKLEISEVNTEPNIENIYAYVESGLPVILGIEQARLLPWWGDEEGNAAHAVVAIGHTLTEDGKIDGLIIHDVSKYPYQILNIPINGRHNLEDICIGAIVPVPKEVRIRYEIAHQNFIQLITRTGISTEGIEFRPMLVEANKIKRWLGEGRGRENIFQNYKVPKKVRDDFLRAYMDRYVWLFELKRELGNGTREYVGDVLCSATHPRILGWNLPEIEKYVFRDLNGEIIEERYP